MRRVFVCVIALLVSACGYNPEEPLYDTQANPSGFPQQALRMISLVETDSLRTVERANIEFGELYVKHPALLDDSDWRTIISRMGSRFTLRAEQELKNGLPGFESAANYYTLAAFARPEDKAAQRMARLLEPWLRAKLSGHISSDLESPPRNSQQLHQQLESFRFFVFGDSLSQMFAREMLQPEVVKLINRSRDLVRTMQDNLSLADRCLLASMGVIATPPNTQAVFADPDIALLTHRLTRVGDGGLRLELYLLPRTAVAEDFTVAVNARLPTDPEAANPTERPGASFDFRPSPSTSSWAKGELVALGQMLPVTGIADSLWVGLYYDSDQGRRWAKLANTHDTLLTLSRAGTP
jgi:hypothetical protein